MVADHKENGTESLNRWWSDLEKADTQFSVSRVHCPEERSKAKEVDNYQYTSVLMEKRLKLFFAQLFLLTSSVSTEQSEICVRNTGLVKQERGDPCWQDNLTHCLSQQVCWWQHLHLRLNFLHKKIFLQKYKDRVERLSQQKPSDQNLYQCRILDNSWSRTVLHDKGHWRVLTIYRTSDMSWVHFTKRWKSSDPKGWIRGNTKIGPVLEVTTIYLQGKYGV